MLRPLIEHTELETTGTMSTPTSNKCILCKSPDRAKILRSSIFLADSIEMGKAIDWQQELTSALSARYRKLYRQEARDSLIGKRSR